MKPEEPDTMQTFSIRLPLLGQLVMWPAEKPRQGQPWLDFWRDGDAYWCRLGRRTFVYDTAKTLARYSM